MSFPADICRPSMLRRRRTSPVEPVSIMHEDHSIRKQTVSVIFSVLPSSIQSRLPPILSRPTTPTGSASGNRSWNSPTSSGTTTPYTEPDTLLGDRYGIVPFESAAGALHHTGDGSGVDWRCGRPGLELLISAVDESKRAAVVRSGQIAAHDPTFERTAYVDGLSYLLRGLPRDLDDTELAVLRKAFPPAVVEGDTSAGQLLHRPLQSAHAFEKPSMLHKSLRAVVARAIVWFCILWPYVLVLLRWAAAYEKKHRVSEQVMAQALALVTVCGKWVVGISEAICSRGDGRLGKALADTLAWTVHDMVAGVSQGVRDGLSRAGSVSDL